MKKVILGLLTAATITSIVGCGGTSPGNAQANNNSIVESTESVESASWETYDGPSATKEEWESDPFLTDIPYPEMNNINIDYESSTWTDIFVYQVTANQFKTYANKLKTAGFTENMLLNDYMFMGNKDEETSMVLGYNSDTGILEISYHYAAK